MMDHPAINLLKYESNAEYILEHMLYNDTATLSIHVITAINLLLPELATVNPEDPEGPKMLPSILSIVILRKGEGKEHITAEYAELCESKKVFEAVKRDRKNSKLQDQQTIEDSKAHALKLKKETVAANTLYLQYRNYYRFLSLYFAIEERLEEFLEIEEGKEFPQERFNVLLNFMEVKLNYEQSKKLIATILQKLYAENSPLSKAQKETLTIVVVNSGDIGAAKHCTVSPSNLKSTSALKALNILISKTNNKNIEEYNLALRYLLYYILQNKNELLERRKSDGYSILHIFVEYAMNMKVSESEFSKAEVLKKYIEILLYNLEASELKTIMQLKNNKNKTAIQLFFNRSQSTHCTTQLSKKGLGLINIIMRYSIEIPIKCNNIFWANSYNFALLSSIHFAFEDAKKYYVSKKTCAYLYSIHKAIGCYIGLSNFVSNAESITERVKQSSITGYSESNTWDINAVLFVGVLGYVQSYFSFTPIVGTQLKMALENNSCGISGFDYGIFSASDFKRYVEQNNMSYTSLQTMYNILVYRKNALTCEFQNLSWWNPIYYYFKNKVLHTALSEVEECIQYINENKTLDTTPKPNFEKKLEESFKLPNVEIKQNMVLNGATKVVSNLAYYAGFNVDSTSVKMFFIKGFAYAVSGITEAAKYCVLNIFTQNGMNIAQN